MAEQQKFSFKDSHFRDLSRRRLFIVGADDYRAVAAYISALTLPTSDLLLGFGAFVRRELEQAGQQVGGLHFVVAAAQTLGSDAAAALLAGEANEEQNLEAIDNLLIMVEAYQAAEERGELVALHDEVKGGPLGRQYFGTQKSH